MKKKLLAPTLVAVALTLVGCGAESTSTTTAAAAGSTASAADRCGGGVQPAVVRGDSYYDYAVMPNLSTAIETYDVAVAGRVIGWTDGRSVFDVEHVQRYATVAIQVDAAAKVADPSQREVAYVAVDLGTEMVNPEGVAADNKPTPDALERAIPAGTRIIAIGNTARSPEDPSYAPTVEIEDDDAGRPAGAPLFGLTVQGALVETVNGCTTSIRTQDREISAWTAHAAELARSDATDPASPGSFQNLVDELASYEPR